MACAWGSCDLFLPAALLANPAAHGCLLFLISLQLPLQGDKSSVYAFLRLYEKALVWLVGLKHAVGGSP